jgi:hypothetical protein
MIRMSSGNVAPVFWPTTFREPGRAPNTSNPTFSSPKAVKAPRR